MFVRLLFLVVAPMIPAAPEAGVPESVGAADFQRIRSLAGDWRGVYEWSGARSGRGAMVATYRPTGHGTAIVETLTTGGEPAMTSVYHTDGDSLRITHFCAAGNQPRLRAGSRSDDPQIIRFVYVDATNLGDPPRPHVDGFEMRFLDAAHLELTFHFTAPAGVSLERISLARTAPPS